MNITAKDVKGLREITGAGMMACKEALGKTNNNKEQAIDYLRKKGLASSKKKQSRIATEGLIFSLSLKDHAVILEVNCETDFVTKGEEFKNFVQKIARHILEHKPKDREELLQQKFDDSSNSILECIGELILKCGEKITIRRFQKVSFPSEKTSVGSYNHLGKIGVLVSFTSGKDLSSEDSYKTLQKDVAMHITASDPQFLKSEDIDPQFKERESAIYREQLKEAGKKEGMISQIIKGKLRKLASEVCLLNQKFAKDPNVTIEQLLSIKAKEWDTTLTINSFIKFNLGEGLEKKNDNLIAEVTKITDKTK